MKIKSNTSGVIFFEPENAWDCYQLGVISSKLKKCRVEMIPTDEPKINYLTCEIDELIRTLTRNNSG